MSESISMLIRSDYRRYRAYARQRFGYTPLTSFADPGFVCVAVHRLVHALYRRGWRKLSWWGRQLNSTLTGADIEPGADFGPGLLIPHPVGVALSTRAGRNLTVCARAGCGGSVQSKDVGAGPGLPLLGNDVSLGDHCGLEGGIVIGDDAVIESGAGALVDIPAGGRGVLASDPLCVEEPDEVDQRPVLVPQCSHGHWHESWRAWKTDVERLCTELERYEQRPTTRLRRLLAACSNSLIALLVHRVSHWLHVNGWTRLARAAAALNFLLHKLSIPPRSCLGPGVLIPHLSAVLVDGVTGSGATIYANCVISGLHGEQPIAGSSLALAGHAGLIGAVRAGDDVRLAPKVQLTSSVAGGAQAFSPMSRVRRIAHGEYVRPKPHEDVPPKPSSPLKEWRRCRTADKERLRAFGRPVPVSARLSVALFRLSTMLLQQGHQRSSRWLWRANLYLTGSDLAADSLVGPGLLLLSPAGVSLFGTVGENLTLHAQTMIVPEVDHEGERSRRNAPILSSNVTLEPHSGICGPICVGQNARIRAGCTVRFAVEDGRTVTPRPLRIRFKPIAAASAKR